MQPFHKLIQGSPLFERIMGSNTRTVLAGMNLSSLMAAVTSTWFPDTGKNDLVASDQMENWASLCGIIIQQ